jgi:hypothetical protein
MESSMEVAQKIKTWRDPRWQSGQGIRIPKLHDSGNHLETSELHLGNSDCF